ncbi:MAG TPA: NADH-ubiquinone oxidoreductase-F iron-sulfur binding region domain-containing protein [Candidatus Dormibacteraeota bacterium]|nr:NADH-ubiquinone oxidoreductase-F iron-sulfur binding region domain-containing protein [Candidatus Dormibacteraeota bacterium]
MDIRTTGGPPTAEETAAVDSVLGDPTSLWEGGERRPADDHIAFGGRSTRSQRPLLLPVLHAIQDRVGWVSRGALEYACRRLSIPPAEAYGVVSFYGRFALDERPPLVLHVCDDIACKCAGADVLCAALEKSEGPAGQTWQRSPCLGLCDRAPAGLVERAGPGHHERQLAGLTIDTALGILRGGAWPELKPLTPKGRGGLLRRVGVIDPESIDSYRSHGGYAALRRAIELGQEGVIREVTEAKLLGRGGAAFPTGRKWDSVAKAPVRPHHLVCNADESEPGTFKDRVLMESDPFAVVEAMTIAAFATGCEQGYLYVRGEYPLARRRIENAIDQARAHGFLGGDIEGRGVPFDIEVRRGAGAYICGEETALFNSIEGKRGEPRNKPPFPVQAGLFGKPTLVNNVETLVSVLDIVVEGGAAFARTGTADSTGTRLFCLSGQVREPGLYEVPMGTTLRALIDLAGGLREGRSLQAVLLGGAAGSFVTEQQLDVQLSFEGTRAIGATLGSGAVIVLDDSTDVKQILLRIARFFRDESCGQCVPCRVGTVRQEEVLHRLLAADRKDSDVALFSDIAQAMRDASICGLGQTAANAIASGLTQLKVING